MHAKDIPRHGVLRHALLQPCTIFSTAADERAVTPRFRFKQQ